MELQLQHSAEIKATIDRAWGVTQNKYKKKDATNAPPDISDLRSRENLQLVPLGQDYTRKRYWVVDGSCVVHFCYPITYLHVFGARPHFLYPHDIRR